MVLEVTYKVKCEIPDFFAENDKLFVTLSLLKDL